ncbi:hypothetical protein HOT99_gp138 [Caulobacter phage CcrBL10]|uniref:Uncharacterized protein n=1 Tax=Caulobacter phage CcrBL10 TaxID=2283269 RepID=A0A385ECQ1_9CAUD|nr:hypothetical protein HOT99_gp138 [Caulobacter phage CcrBL10]AXQ68479.1 hypothetical protein CcrBL10_gp275 [Caulobacter phage CcrBL10]
MTMSRTVKVERGKTTYYVTIDEAGEVIAISGVAVVGKVPRYKGGTRRVPWSGAHWHAGYKTRSRNN